eukprot:gnl/TRDRNA2_/TRDRNA2_175176_c2_seq2.p1 gnl/TRDRNA2_/TRDRNA2_175176_c2~~gnl/TRDRNA2_/TRDRNA2_175176_c2_seq2.p1  ORF type:complete len:259 (+),score=22.02 gnl/TRDRNA2_/TRDRNA2_175176_c2_seq2:140-916(+)
MLEDGFFETIHQTVVVCGKSMDSRLGEGCCKLQVPPRIDLPSECAGFRPSIPLNLRGMVVVFKPSTWEVDGRSSLLVTNPDVDDGRVGLSSFVQAFFPKEIFALPHWSDFDHGFLHRLDIPSSGLVLVGVTMEGYFSLRLQLNTYRLAREYFVICHGTIPAVLKQINLGIGSTIVRVRRSTADDFGKPAETHVKLLQHLVIRASSRPHYAGGQCTAVAIRIRTGRHHQIRTHMLHSGYPTASDAKYTMLDLLSKGAVI